MKRLLIISMAAITTSTVVSAEGLVGPTDAELMEVSFNFIEESKKAMAQKPEEDCDTTAEQKMAVKAPVKPENEIVCICELPEGKQTLLSPLIGNLLSTDITVNTGNDNLFHGVLQSSDFRKYDGDDRARTFNLGSGIKFNGKDGSLELKVDSTGFGRFSPQNGYKKDAEGRHYLNYREMNTFDVRLERNFDTKNVSNLYAIGEFNLTHLTDEGFASRKVQNWWHQTSQQMTDRKIIQYNYLKEEDAKTSVTLMTGIGKSWMADLGNWKCATKAELRMGLTATSKGAISPEVAVRSEMKVSHSAVKWIALSAWTQAKSGYLGKSYQGGMTLSMPFKTKNYTIEPFIGIERHKTDLDKKYSETGKASENYHVFGVTIKY